MGLLDPSDELYAAHTALMEADAAFYVVQVGCRSSQSLAEHSIPLFSWYTVGAPSTAACTVCTEVFTIQPLRRNGK